MKVSDGNHFTISEDFVEGGIPYYRGQDVAGQFFVENSLSVGISRKAFDAPYMKRSHLRDGDVLLSIVGTIGESSLVSSDRDATCSCKLAILRPTSIVPAYLASFLQCKYGRSQTVRLTRGAVQMGLILEDMDQLTLPVASKQFQFAIESIVVSAREHFGRASLTTLTAEQTLLSALGMADWRPPEPLSYVRSSRDVFAAGRLDAESYQPKFEEVVKILKDNATQYQLCRLGDLSEPLKYGSSAQLDYVDSGRPFLRIADLVNKRFELSSVLHVAVETEFRNSELVRKDDVLVSRSGSLGIGVPIPVELSGAAYGSYFIRTRPDTTRINPEFLALVLNTLPGMLQVEAKSTGGVQTNLTISAIESILIPVGSLEWQATFVEKIEYAKATRRHGSELLEAAKRAVEIAIEDSEVAAMAYLESVRIEA